MTSGKRLRECDGEQNLQCYEFSIDGMITDLVREGASRIVATMGRDEEDPHVQLQGLQNIIVLATFVTKNVTKNELTKELAPDINKLACAIISAMKNHRHGGKWNEEIQLAACSAIGYLANGDAAADIIIEALAANNIIRAMEHTMTTVRLREKGCIALWRLVEQSSSDTLDVRCFKQLLSSDTLSDHDKREFVPSAIFRAMKYTGECPQIFIYGCRAIEQIVMKVGFSDDLNAETRDTLSSYLKTFPNNEDVQNAGLSVLAHLNNQKLKN